MKKFNAYNGFYTKPYPKPKYSPNFSTQSSQHDKENTTLAIDEKPPCSSTNIEPDLANHIAKSTTNINTYQEDVDKISQSNTPSQPILYNLGEEDSREYIYNHVEETPLPISMKTRRLIQLSRTHERAIEAIIAANNNVDYSPKIR